MGDRVYQIPKLPHKTYKSLEKATLDRPVPLLSEQTLLDLRQLIEETFAVLRAQNIAFWVTGGTLISAELWGHLMPFDDDADISLLFSDKDQLWCPETFAAFQKAGLECFVLKGVTRTYAPTREASAVRVRRQGTHFPVVDIFFLDWDDQQQKWAHVNSWTDNQPVFDQTTEVWEKDWLFPLQEKNVDGMRWPVAAQPQPMLDKHYGPEWKTVIQSPDKYINSHKYAHWITDWLQVWVTLTPEHPRLA